MDFRTLCVHAGGEIDAATGAVTPAIHPSSTFARGPDGELLGAHMYGRYGNPTRDRLETALATLERGGCAFAFPTGLAASMAIFRAICRPGDRVLIPADLYFGVRAQLMGELTAWGVLPEIVDFSDEAALDAALGRGVRLVWMETPSNPQLRITDVEAVARAARNAGALTAVDNTWPSPVLTRPLELGVDLVLHSTTKYLAGHSDVVGGAVILPDGSPWEEALRAQQTVGGSVAGPFDAWLTLRGLRTLSLRVRAACESAQHLAEWLEARVDVVRVAYPGLPSDPGHAIAARQMHGGFGGMLSARFGSEARAAEICGRLELWTRATSLGGVESLVEHRARIEGPDTETPRDLLRFSVGIEAVEDLVTDLDRALGDR